MEKKIKAITRKLGKEPCLSDFSSFVHEETTFFNNLIFSKDAVPQYVKNVEMKHDKKKKYGDFATKVGKMVKFSLYKGNRDLDNFS